MLQDFTIKTKNTWFAVAGPSFTFTINKNGSFYTTVQNQTSWEGAKRAAHNLIQLYKNLWE